MKQQTAAITFLGLLSITLALPEAAALAHLFVVCRVACNMPDTTAAFAIADTGIFEPLKKFRCTAEYPTPCRDKKLPFCDDDIEQICKSESDEYAGIFNNKFFKYVRTLYAVTIEDCNEKCESTVPDCDFNEHGTLGKIGP